MRSLCKSLFVIFITLLPSRGYAQVNQPEPERGSILPGYIITLQGDTVKGHLLNINLWLNQKMTFFYKDPEDREGRVKYKPKEIKAYQVGPRYYESVDHPFTNSMRSDNFLLRKVDGQIKYYVWYLRGQFAAIPQILCYLPSELGLCAQRYAFCSVLLD